MHLPAPSSYPSPLPWPLPSTLLPPSQPGPFLQVLPFWREQRPTSQSHPRRRHRRRRRRRLHADPAEKGIQGLGFGVWGLGSRGRTQAGRGVYSLLARELHQRQQDKDFISGWDFGIGRALGL